MTGSIPVPAKGQPMKASWAAAVADRVNALCGMAPSDMLVRDGVGGMGAQPLPENMRGKLTKPHPYEIRFASDLGEGGEWIIWLPSGRILIVDDAPVDATEDLDDAGTPYPAGWYVLDCVTTTPAAVWLNIHVDDTTGDMEAVFATSVDTAEEGERVWPVQIANITASEIVQLVSSVIIARVTCYYL